MHQIQQQQQQEQLPGSVCDCLISKCALHYYAPACLQIHFHSQCDHRAELVLAYKALSTSRLSIIQWRKNE